MAIETVADAISAACVLHTGRDPHLAAKLEWWQVQLGGDTPLSAITADTIDAGIQALIESPANRFSTKHGVVIANKQRSNATINRYVAALGSMYKLLKTHRRLPRSYVVPSMKGLRLPEGKGRTLTVSLADVHALVASARLSYNPKVPALIAVACTTGLRKGNIQALTWGDVDLKTRTIDVSRTKNGTATRSMLPEWAAAELARIRPENPDRAMPIFGTKDFKRAWIAAVSRTNLQPDLTFHHCRHIAASILAQSGAALPVIMQALNHKSPSMALRYSHANTKALDTAVSAAWG